MAKNYQCIAAVLAALLFTGCAAQKTAAPKPDTDNNQSAEADKVLYDRAMNDLKHNRFELERLSMQTLINTYPDSEYLAKAKLAIADSYFKEGGTTGLTQAVAQYQDFITFFPFLDEAAYAQMQIGMAHYKRMEKADRDTSEALEAEAALQTFVQKYPRSELLPQAEQRLREVQEVLADGDFEVASFYYLRRIDKAAAPRLIDLVNRYPLYSEADRANWMLASIYERNEHNDIASTYYTRLVKEYPLSPLANSAKAKLVKFGAPVPQPDPTAMARMEREQQTPRQRPSFLKSPTKILKSGPNVSAAAHFGAPTLTPQSEDATDTLAPGAGLSVVAGGNGSGASGGSTTGAYVQTVSPGSADPAAPAPAPTPTTPDNSGNAAAGADPPAASSSTQNSQAGQTAASSSAGSNAGQAASGSDPAANQSSQPTSQAESSSKKKKGKKQAQLQSQ
jgi:outer membrane protein assembly factor BamD